MFSIKELFNLPSLPKSFLIGIACLTPFFYLAEFIIIKEFFELGRKEMPIIFAFCLSFVILSINSLISSYYQSTLRPVNYDVRVMSSFTMSTLYSIFGVVLFLMICYYLKLNFRWFLILNFIWSLHLIILTRGANKIETIIDKRAKKIQQAKEVNVELNRNSLPFFILKYHARSAATTSSLRNQVLPGGIANCRSFLERVKIEEFKNALIDGDYESFLDQKTEELLLYAKPYELKWGSARKVLNILFRKISLDAQLMGTKLSDELLNKLQIPIDSKVAHSLLAVNNLKRSRWKTIVGLSKSEHQFYQDLAQIEAKKGSVPVVFLDFKYWTE